MFGHIFKNRLKIVLRQKSVIFWTLLFPIALSTFFNMALTGAFDTVNFKVVDIAIIDNDSYKNETNFKTMIESISKENDDQVFNVVYVSIKEAEELLDNNDISGYIEVKDKINIIVKSTGIDQTVIKTVVDNYYQTNSTVGNIIKYDPELLKTGLLDNLNNSKNYFKETTNDEVKMVVIYFYSLIGMTCLYGGLFGVNAINEVEANLSKKAARINVSPSHKFKVLIAYLLVAIIVHYSEILILMFYLTNVLSVNFGSNLGYILLLEFFGCLAGITLGTFIGSSSRKSEDAKTGILSAVVMSFSFLAGLMVWQMKYIIMEKVPVLSYINPVNMITDGLYSLYYYNTYDRFFFNIFSLIVFSFLMTALTYVFIRRKNYDSI